MQGDFKLRNVIISLIKKKLVFFITVLLFTIFAIGYIGYYALFKPRAAQVRFNRGALYMYSWGVKNNNRFLRFEQKVSITAGEKYGLVARAKILSLAGRGVKVVVRRADNNAWLHILNFPSETQGFVEKAIIFSANYTGNVFVTIITEDGSEAVFDKVSLLKLPSNFSGTASQLINNPPAGATELLKNPEFDNAVKISYTYDEPKGWGAGGNNWGFNYGWVRTSDNVFVVNAPLKNPLTGATVWVRFERKFVANSNKVDLRIRAALPSLKKQGVIKVLIACGETNGCGGGKRINDVYGSLTLSSSDNLYHQYVLPKISVPTGKKLYLRIMASGGAEALIDWVKVVSSGTSSVTPTPTSAPTFTPTPTPIPSPTSSYNPTLPPVVTLSPTPTPTISIAPIITRPGERLPGVGSGSVQGAGVFVNEDFVNTVKITRVKKEPTGWSPGGQWVYAFAHSFDLVPNATPTPTTNLTPTPTSGASPTLAPTSTLTPTPTSAPTSAPTLTPTPTLSPGSLTLKLLIKFQGILSAPKSGVRSLNVKVGLQKVGSDKIAYKTVKFDYLGAFGNEDGVWVGKVDFDPGDGFVSGDDYYIFVKGPKHLQKKVCSLKPTEFYPGAYRCEGNVGVTLTAGEHTVDMSSIYLLVGDLPDQDGVVNAYDISLVRNLLGKTDADSLSKADVNYDGVVDTQDFALIQASLSVKYDDY